MIARRKMGETKYAPRNALQTPCSNVVLKQRRRVSSSANVLDRDVARLMQSRSIKRIPIGTAAVRLGSRHAQKLNLF